MTDGNRRMILTGTLLAVALLFAGGEIALADGAAPPATTPASQPASAQWPQWRGPDRDGIAPSSPKLLDSWPKEGPPLLWKSDWIPACQEGGCSSPVVADGKVFVYANAKLPVDGGKPYHLVTTELLLDCGWLPDLPDDLAKKIEAAWAAKTRPDAGGWDWLNTDKAKRATDLEALLAKKPELDKYIKDFVATLTPDEATKYGEYVKKRLCIPLPKNAWGAPTSLTWEQLVRLSALREKTIPTLREWEAELNKVGAGSLVCFPGYPAWKRIVSLSDTVVCLDAATGKTIWRKDFPVDMAKLKKEKGHQWWTHEEGFVSATPAISGGKCYAVGSMGLYCLAAKDGALLWKVEAEAAHASPLVAGGIVYNGGNGRAYDAETGKLLWRNPLWSDAFRHDDTGAYSSPLLWTSGGKNYVVSSDAGAGQYVCLELETGTVVWTVKGSINVMTTLCNDVLIVAAPYGGSGSSAHKLTPGGAEMLWKRPFGDGSGDIIWQDHLYVPGGVYKCLDVKTGETNWKTPPRDERNGNGGFSAAVLADGKIFTPVGAAHQLTKNFGDLTYSMVMIKASPDKYVELGSFNPRMCMMTSPAFVGGKMYLRLLTGIACYDLQDHGVYLDGVTAQTDSLTFRFKQTGGGLVAKADGGLKDVVITDAAGAAKPASAKIDGDSIVVDVKDAAVPFSISLAGTNALAGKNGQPVPAFTWNEPRLLKARKCIETTLLLTSDVPLQQLAYWHKAETYAVAGAKVTSVVLDPQGKGVSLATDKTWKPGETVTVTYPCFAVDQGDGRREKLTFTVAEPQRAAAKFVKADEIASGNWKGTYGAEGAVVAGDRGKVGGPTCAVVTPANKVDAVPWAFTPENPLAMQLPGDNKGHSNQMWNAPEQMDIGVEVTDGKEHEVALYFPFGGSITVEVVDADTKAVLDTQYIKDKSKVKYLVWNIKGQVIMHITSTIQDEGHAVWVGGVLIGSAPAAQPAK